MTYTPVDEDVDPNLPVLECAPDILPLELIGFSNLDLITAGAMSLALVLEAKDNKCPLIIGEEAGRLRKVI